MVYKYVSIFNVIEKLYRDYEHQEELDVWDIIEWAAEALEFIGAGQAYEEKIIELTIANNIAVLPCDFHSKPQPSYLGKPMSLANGSFAPMSQGGTGSGTSSTATNVTPNNNAASLINTGDDRVNGFAVDDDKFPTSGNTSASSIVPASYYIRDGIFVASFESGTVLLEYRGIKTDCDGYPMIPDLVSYKEAVAKYCQMKLDHRDWRKKRITRDIYAETSSDWQWYCGQARGQANMPNLSYAESFKRQWVKLKPNQNSHDTFYNDLSIREMLKHK